MKTKLCFIMILVISVCNIGYLANDEKWVEYPDAFFSFGHPKIFMNIDNERPKIFIANLESDYNSSIVVFGFDGRELKKESFQIYPPSLYNLLTPIEEIAFYDLNNDSNAEAIIISGYNEIMITVLSWNRANNSYNCATSKTFNGIDLDDVGLFYYKGHPYVIVRNVVQGKGHKKIVKYIVYKIEYINIKKIVENNVSANQWNHFNGKLVVNIKGQTYLQLISGKYWTFNGKDLVASNEIKDVIIKVSGQIIDINSDNKLEYVDYFADIYRDNDRGIVVYDLRGNVLYKKHGEYGDIFKAYGEEHSLVGSNGAFITVNKGDIVFTGSHSLFLQNANHEYLTFALQCLYHQPFRYKNKYYEME